jgi:hypothetical protein
MGSTLSHDGSRWGLGGLSMPIIAILFMGGGGSHFEVKAPITDHFTYFMLDLKKYKVVQNYHV